MSSYPTHKQSKVAAARSFWAKIPPKVDELKVPNSSHFFFPNSLDRGSLPDDKHALINVVQATQATQLLFMLFTTFQMMQKSGTSIDYSVSKMSNSR